MKKVLDETGGVGYACSYGCCGAVRGGATIPAERAACGVRGVWVHPGHRRRGVASDLISAARHGTYGRAGYVAGAGEVAFTQPTEAGRSLALSLCGGGTGTFLVY